MSVRVGINGFGRMGRLALRAAWGWPELEFVHINEVEGGRDGRPPAHVRLGPRPLGPRRGGGRWLGCRRRPCSRLQRRSEPGDVPWGELGVDIVLECSGKFRTPETLEPYFERGVRKVIVAAPVKEEARSTS